jgi:membrane protease YdiL (CAAX protease family)
MTNEMPEVNPEINPVIISELTPSPPVEKRLWGGWATAGFGAVILFALFLVMVIVMGIVALALAFSQGDAAFSLEGFTDSIYANIGLLISISGIVAYAAAAGLILAFIKARGGAGISEYLGLKRISWRTVLAVVLITAAFLGASYLLDYFFHTEEGDTQMLVDIYNTSVWPVLLWITVVVFAPLFEEGLFRGFLFEGFRRSRLGLISTIIVTSLIWTCLHAGYSVSSLGAIFVFGLVLGAVRYKTGSLWTTMLMHACYNAVGMVLIAANLSG